MRLSQPLRTAALALALSGSLAFGAQAAHTAHPDGAAHAAASHAAAAHSATAGHGVTRQDNNPWD